MNSAKKPYQPPKVEELGTVEELTLGNAIGAFLDADYPTNTPQNELTFSG